MYRSTSGYAVLEKHRSCPPEPDTSPASNNDAEVAALTFMLEARAMCAAWQKTSVKCDGVGGKVQNAGLRLRSPRHSIFPVFRVEPSPDCPPRTTLPVQKRSPEATLVDAVLLSPTLHLLLCGLAASMHPP